jgi:hypothetical protein
VKYSLIASLGDSEILLNNLFSLLECESESFAVKNQLIFLIVIFSDSMKRRVLEKLHILVSEIVFQLLGVLFSKKESFPLSELEVIFANNAGEA